MNEEHYSHLQARSELETRWVAHRPSIDFITQFNSAEVLRHHHRHLPDHLCVLQS